MEYWQGIFEKKTTISVKGGIQMKRLILLAHETISEQGTLVRPIKGVPEGFWFACMNEGEKHFVFEQGGWKLGIHKIKNRYPAGRYWIAEGWRIIRMWRKRISKSMRIFRYFIEVQIKDRKTVVYEVSKKYHEKLEEYMDEWRLPQHMPRTFARSAIEIMGVEVKRAYDTTPQEFDILCRINNNIDPDLPCSLRHYRRIEL